MRFLVDQNLPAALSDWLVKAGHDADHVSQLNLADADDEIIVELARGRDAIVITRDRDFGRLTSMGRRQPRVVWVRFGNTTNPELFRKWSMLWPEVEAALNDGETFLEVG